MKSRTVKIVVCIKHVPDPAAVTWQPGAAEIDPGARRAINPYDEHALEAAVQLAEAIGSDGETEVEIVEEKGQLVLRLKARDQPTSGLDGWVGFLAGEPRDVDAFIEDIRGR